MNFLKYSISISVLILAIGWTLPAKAFMTPQIRSAMGEASLCQKIRSSGIYAECMSINNDKIAKAIKTESQLKTQNFSKAKKKRTLIKINKAVKANLKHCLDEQSLSGNSIDGQRRHSYCVYENMLERLINVSNHIENYSRR